MTALRKPSAWGSFAPLRQKLFSLGVKSEVQLDELLSRIRVGTRIDRGEDILTAGSTSRYSTILIEGVACLYERLVDGSRQIYSFQYPGDFCDLSRHVLRVTTTEVAVAAITECSIGFVENSALEQMLAQYPELGLVLWRSTILEAGMLRARVRGARQTALQRVAHILCEQSARLAAIGIDSRTIPVSQIDLADAVGLSVVHINRTFRELQGMGLLSKVGRSMKVVDREKLARLADFDGSYLNMPKLLAGWKVSLGETDPMRLGGPMQ